MLQEGRLFSSWTIRLLMPFTSAFNAKICFGLEFHVGSYFSFERGIKSKNLRYE